MISIKDKQFKLIIHKFLELIQATNENYFLKLGIFKNLFYLFEEIVLKPY